MPAKPAGDEPVRPDRRRLRLVSIGPETARFLADTGKEFETHVNARIGDHLALARDVVEQTAALLARCPRPDPWGTYFAVDADRGDLVGTCAFKLAPADGVVEIAYFTFPAFEGQGYATAMAAELVRIAEGSPLVRHTLAHTLPERNASASVLEKNGFRCAGEVIDPEDGRVWRWERPAAGAAASL